MSDKRKLKGSSRTQNQRNAIHKTQATKKSSVSKGKRKKG